MTRPCAAGLWPAGGAPDFETFAWFQVLTNQRDVSGGGLNLQTGPHLPLAGGHSGGNSGGAQRLIGGVVINQQSLAAVTGGQTEVRGQAMKERRKHGRTNLPGRIL